MLGVHGQVKSLSRLSENVWLADYPESSQAAEAIKQKFMVMNIQGNVHDLAFSEHPETPRKDKPHGETKSELRLVLKRQVLREMVFDPDFNPQCNFLTFG